MAILPLSDVVVLEFSHTVMGPSCGVVLADLGADVIRVEPAPDGDRTRRLHGFATGFFAYFNRNKRCICIDAEIARGTGGGAGPAAQSRCADRELRARHDGPAWPWLECGARAEPAADLLRAEGLFAWTHTSIAHHSTRSRST